ncbi:hypothetical protein ACEPAF_7867 [Sanghuangporus sanghuang]
MASQRQRRANCQICTERESKYACPTCDVLYCSVSCYREHKRCSCSASAIANIGSDTSIAIVDGNAMNAEIARIESSPSTSRVEDDNSRRRQPSLLASDGDAAQPQVSRFPSTSESRTSVQIPLDSDAFPSAILPPHVRQGEPRSGSAGDIDAENTKIGEKSIHLEMQKHAEEGANTSPVDEAGARLASGFGPEPEPGPRRESRSNPSRPDSPFSDAPTTPRPLRKLSSLKWPYVPDTPSYPDPLTRDDPKPLNLPQYEAIARSPAVRRALSSHPRLPTRLRSLDALRGDARERAIERVLGVAPDQASFVLAGLPPSSNLRGPTSVGREALPEVDEEEDMRALRALAEAVEAAVRRSVGGNPDARSGTDPLGLDWESMEA